MPNPWLNEHKSMAAMNYFLIETVWPGCDFLPKYTQIHHKIVFIVQCIS
jgi:hypothetical protein